MKSYLTTAILIIILFLSSGTRAQNVIIAIVDGARYSETFGAGDTYIPHLYNDMRPIGTLYTNFGIDYPSGLTETCSGHSAVETGTWQPIADDGSERPTKPTVFEYMRQEDGYPQSDFYAVTGKSKLDILTYSTYSGYGSAYGGTWYGDNNKNDSQTYDKVIEVMSTYHPKILVINFAQVDAAGHTGNWSDYLAAITNADNYVYQLWQHIEAGDYGYTPGNTTLFITNDHGRHDDAHGGFKNHGDGCEGCTHIMLLALGRGVTPNQELDFAAWQRDIALTAGDLLDFQTPYADGTSLFDYPTPIPVELLNFKGKLQGDSVVLEWATATEANSMGFEIQRKDNDRWTTIGFVQGNGNSVEIKKYHFIDRIGHTILTGNLYYRLKQIDFDGSANYSEALEIKNFLPGGYKLEQNFPNPFNPSTTIGYSIPSPSLVLFEVYDILGTKVQTLVNAEKAAGSYEVNFNASSLPGGVYFYKITAGNFSDAKKMVLVK